MVRDNSFDIAVTGRHVRVADCRDFEELWERVLHGDRIYRPVSEDDFSGLIATPPEFGAPDHVPVCGFMRDFLRFDNRFFRISNADAQLMDPQLRLMLEVGWGALEDAGIGDPARRPLTGVFASSTGSGYLRAILSQFALDPVALDKAIHGTEADFLATNLAFRLNLCGPAITVQTACSSSLVAVHLACRSLLEHECDAALVIAAGLPYPQAGHRFVEGGIKSGTGSCRPFDANADGIVEGTGVVALVLQRLEDLKQRDARPHGIILGSAIGNDGSLKQAYTAPSVDGQVRTIKSALATADVSPDSVCYLECHGTGTRLGDPVEWAAATQAYGSDPSAPEMWVGTSKANAGHLDGAAGLLGLVKALHVVSSGEIPPVAGFEQINPLLNEAPSRLAIPTHLIEWSSPEPRRAGVSAFGVGGTNAHVVIQGITFAADTVETKDNGSARLLALTAPDSEALERMAERLADHLEANDSVPLDDIAYTLAVGRARFSHRLAVSATSKAQATAVLRSKHARACGHWNRASCRPVIMLFPGQGGQTPGMGLAWAKGLPGFKPAAEKLLGQIEPDLAAEVFDALFDERQPPEFLEQTSLAQPALCVLALAATMSLKDVGVRCFAAIGHSLGEVAALAAAGGIEPLDALRFAVRRGAAMQRCPPGRMIAVTGPIEDVRSQLERMTCDADIAAINGPTAITLAVAEDHASELEAELATRWRTRRLRGNRAFHSRFIENTLPEIEQAAEALSAMTLSCPVARNETGRVELPGERPDLESLTRQARSCVLFDGGLKALNETLPNAITVEIGPGGGLTALAVTAGLEGIPLGRSKGAGDLMHVHRGLGELWASGGGEELPEMLNPEGRLARIPLYPFRGPNCVHPSLAPSACSSQAIASNTSPANTVDLGVDPLDALTAAWCDLLGVDVVSEDLDFYDAGGDSLTLIRLAARLKSVLSPHIRWQDLADRMSFAEQLEWLKDTHVPGQATPKTGRSKS